MKKNEVIDFSWGNPYFLLDVLNTKYQQKLSPHDIKSMSYAPENGREELIELTRKVIKDLTGNTYKYILITNGATSGINAILRIQAKNGYKIVYTHKYGYPFYGEMISKAGLSRLNDLLYEKDTGLKKFRLIDSPNNPSGKQVGFGNPNEDIWDGVYHNKIYTEDLRTAPPHHYFVSSYSKLLGLTGARVGFVATNNEFSHNLLARECLLENATISVPSQTLIVDVLNKVDLESFMEDGRDYLNFNKGEFQKIEYLFGGQTIQKVGMFYCAEADAKLMSLFDKCSVKYVKLDENVMRLSMGQTKEVTTNGIKRILREDKKK